MRAQRRYTPSRATTLPTGMDGATQIGSKHASQTKLLHGLTSSRVATIFAVPRQLDRTRSYSDQFSYLWVGRRPMRNSYLTGSAKSTGDPGRTRDGVDFHSFQIVRRQTKSR